MGDRQGSHSGYQKSFDNMGSDAGDRLRRGPPADDSKMRDLSSWERKGPLAPVNPPPAAKQHLERPSDKDELRERKNSPAWGEGRSQDGSRPPRREFSERPPLPIREATEAEKDNQWRSKMRPDAPAPAPAPISSPALSSRELSTPGSPAAPPPAGPPTSRPKLNLQKRTVSTAEPSPALPSGDSISKGANPFGSARPIDTASKEREIEEKMKVKREQDDKAREEKRAADQKAKEEARVARDAEKAEKLGKARGEKPNGQGKEENGDAPQQPKKYEILRRDAANEEDAATADAEDVPANGIVDDKNVKPQETVRDIKADDAAPEGQTKALEGEGWNVVSKDKKGKKLSISGPRALAS